MILIAHRGYSGRYPENTLLSFEKALEANAEFIEFDVQFSKDKKIIIIHDFTLERTTNSQGFVKNFTLKELKKISAGYPKKFGELYIKETIPTLEEAISLCKNKAILLIEIKREKKEVAYNDGLEESLLKIISNYDCLDKVIFLSFNLNSLIKIKEINSKAITGSLFYAIDEKAIEKSKEIGASFIIFNYQTCRSLEVIKKIKKSNLQVGVYTIDDLRIFNKFQSSGVDAIATNFIKEFMEKDSSLR